MTDELPPPLTPAECDLRDFPFLPIDIARLFGSEFHALAGDAEWRAGITLWLKSFHQVPAASIPDDDIALARLAELGRDVKAWRRLRERALHGWVKCSDGRLYHPVVAEKVKEAWKGKQNQRSRTCKGRISAFLTRLNKAEDDFDFAHIETLITSALQELSQHLKPHEFESVEKSVTDSVTEAKRKREGKGEGKGEGKKILKLVPNGTGGSPPPGMNSKDAIFQVAVPWMVDRGVPDKSARSLMGGAIKQLGDDAAWNLAQRLMEERPVEPASWVAAAINKSIGKTTGANRHGNFGKQDYRAGVEADGSF